MTSRIAEGAGPSGLTTEAASRAGNPVEHTRADIQALRAIAVVAVMLYHLWPSRLKGGFVGVDIFFVISGYLITSHLIRAAPRRPGDFASFWGKRIRRLLPAAVLTILAILAATVYFVSRSQWQSNAAEAVASTFYVENWHLISTATTYLGSTASPSPFQHFWSLSVEEQYYIGWPFIVCVLGLIGARLWPRHVSRVYAAGFLAVVVASLWASVVVTSSNPAVAYFSTNTRMWELGLGGLLAAVYGGLSARLQRRVGLRLFLFWAGIAGIVASLLVITGSTPFPGSAALLPTCAAVSIIAANNPNHRLNPRPLTASRPVQYLGDNSYALYLWHWPLIVIAPSALHHSLTRNDKIALLLVVIVIADLSGRFIENPVRHSRALRKRTWYAFAIGAVASLLVLGSAGLVHRTVVQSEARSQAAVSTRFNSADQCLGIGAVQPAHRCKPATTLVTTPEFANADIPDGITHCLNWPPFATVPFMCTRGVTANPTARIAVLGNSYAAQWLPALEVMALHQRWRVDTYVDAVCLPFDDPQGPWGKGFNGVPAAALPHMCTSFADTVTSLIEKRHYNLVYMSVLDRTPSDAAAYTKLLTRLVRAGTKVVIIRDTPAPMNFAQSTPDCVGRSLSNYTRCNGTPSAWIGADPLAQAARAMNDPRINVIDLNDYLCARQTCPAVIGGVIVYLDIDHLTATIVKTFVPYLEPLLVAELKS